MGKITTHFANKVPALSYTEKHVLYFIDAHLPEAKGMALTTLAKEVNVSTTSVIRMCQKLGFDGFSEFKYALKELGEETRREVTDSSISRFHKDLESTLSNLDEKDINRICRRMKEADRVVIIAVGLSKMFGEYFSKLLMQVNKPSMYIYESHMIDLFSNKVTKGDYIIFISSSGETKTLVETADKMTHQYVYTAAITNNINSTLTTLVDDSISTQVERAEYGGYDLTARSPLVLLVDLIFESYIKLIIEE
ncbi:MULTISPECIES: MurR/RpiR family transcriptional regulator [Alteribacter]|uniref:MurR/RpiR family transcriptional regulator n=1 Tax=Alteribacter keqinensis TaxID=2483800 RepID=A0A3M7TRL5_9BACI|nr:MULTISPECIES: MurR/RpiR family transcriptional regulator [Alteribacter]MBM7095494.1 MurR/RpiR family transcriptional regulator [Alteribacter salitolerans]RNA67907.1 MurR/RpiR family transcriptional regulator [Alteribacter keqinensis]